MLKQMRSGAQSKVIKYFFFGLLLMGTVGLSLFGVQDVFRHGFHSQAVATIGHDKITKTDLDQMLRNELRSKKMSTQDAYRVGLPLVTLTREINSRIFIRAANDLGIIVDDATVRRQIDEMLKPLQDKGMTEKDALEHIEYSFNTSEGRLVANLKAEIAVEKLSHALADGVSAPHQMVNDFMKYRYEWRRGDYIKLTAADAAAKDPSDEELKKLYESSLQAHYMQPEYRSLSVLMLDAQALPGAAKNPEAEAKAFYDQHKAEFGVPEKRTVSEISVGDATLAQSLYSKASIAKDLKKVADEAGKGKVQFSSDTYTQETFIPDELAADVFKAPAGTVLPPKAGPMGRMIIVRVDKIIPGSVKSFEEVKADIEKGLAAQNAGANSEALYKRASDIDEMIGAGKSLADVAQQFSLKTIDFNKIDSQGNDAAGKKADTHGVPDFDQVLKSAWALDKGAISQPIQAADKILFVELRDIQPAQAKPFDVVRSDVLQAWKEKQAGMALDTKAAKIMERLNMGETLEKIAADANKTIQKTPLIQRDAAQQKSNPLEPGVTLALFSIDKLNQATVVPGPGSVTILRLAERKIDAPKEPSKEDTDAMRATLSEALQSDILEQFRRSLMAKYDVKIDEGALKEMYAPHEGAEEIQ